MPPRGLAAPEHLAGIRRQRAGDDADQRAFARAVGAQKAVKPWTEGQGDTGQGLLDFLLSMMYEGRKQIIGKPFLCF